MYSRANTVWRNGFWEVERNRPTRERELFNPVQVDCAATSLIFNRNGFPLHVSPSMFVWTRATWECSRLKEHTRPLSKHVTPELSPPATHAWPLSRLSQWQIRHKKNFWGSPPCWFKAAQYKEKLLSEFIEGTIVDLWNVLPQQKPLRKTSITMLFALLRHVTRCLVPVLALRHVLFKESLVCSRLLW